MVLQIILSDRACVAYIAKYAAKAEKRSNIVNQIMLKAKRAPATIRESAFRKMMTASFRQNDKSHQQVVQLLLASALNLIEHRN